MDNKLKILEELDRQVITAQEAERRLQALRENKPNVQKGKYFKIFIKSNDGDLVNLQVPVGFAKVLLKGTNVFGKRNHLNNGDIDTDEVLDMVESGLLGEIVNIESADGDIVKIYVE